MVLAVVGQNISFMFGCMLVLMAFPADSWFIRFVWIMIGLFIIAISTWIEGRNSHESTKKR